MYGKPQLEFTNDVRFAYFQQNYAPQRADDPLERIKGMNPSSMPPCQYVLLMKVLRSNYVSYLWRNAHLRDPTSNIKPDGQGWIIIENTYHVKWFDCDQVPQSICQVLGMDTSSSYMEQDEIEDQEDTHDHAANDSDDSTDDWE